MARTRSNPIGIEVVGDLTASFPEEDFKRLVERIEEIDRANSGWLRKQEKLIRMRFGPRTPKRLPWKGAANINVPLTDGIIRRWRPGITALLTDANPVAFFHSPDNTDFGAARQAEPFFHWLFLEKMGAVKEAVKLIDLIASRGHAYVREGWCYETERFARIVRTAELFPGGVEATIEQANANAQLQGQEPPNPVDLISKVLEQEYGMDINDEQEGPQLINAAQQILQGAENVRIIFNSIQKDQPEWQALDPIQTIVEHEGDVEDADFFTIIHHMSPDQILRAGRDGKFDGRVAAAVAADVRKDESNTQQENAPALNQRRNIRLLLDQRAGVNDSLGGRQTGNRADIWEIYAKLDINGDGIAEKVVIWYAPKQKEILAFYESPLPFEKWPVTLFLFEPHAPRPVESRGIPELLYELQQLENEIHNMRLNAAQITLSPVFKQKNSSLNFGQTLRWRPGAFFPVNQMNDIEPLVHDLRILQGLLQEEQVTQRIAESFIGTFDATLNQLNNPAERRTAAEVNTIAQLAANVFGLDARMFQESMGRSFTKIWNLYREFGEDATFFRVTGEERARLARKHEIGKRFDIKPAGTPSSTNKALMLQNIERVMPVLLQDNTGLFDKGKLVSQWLRLLDNNLAKEVIRSPEETEQVQLIQQAAQISAQQQGLDQEIPTL